MFREEEEDETVVTSGEPVGMVETVQFPDL